MSIYLREIDKTKNMEDLRNARSYNDLVIIVSRIKSATTSISSKLIRCLSKDTSSMEPIMLGADALDRKELSYAYDYLKSLSSFSYEIQFAKSQISIIAGDAKLDKFRRLLETTESFVNKTYSFACKYINSLGIKSMPKKLSMYLTELSKFLSRSLTFQKHASITIPTLDDRTSFTSFIVLTNIQYTSGYTLPELILAVHADNNFDDTFSYSISFPKSLHEPSSKLSFSNKKQMLVLAEKALLANLKIKSLKEMNDKGRRALELISDVSSAYVDDGFLFIELESGVTSSDVNVVLTKVLALAHTALGVTDIDTDIVHKVSEGQSGNKVIRIGLLDRNFYDMTSFDRLGKLVGLDGPALNKIKSLVGR